MVRVEVYGDVRATCTQRVMILLEELDLKYTVVPVDLTKGEHKSEEFRKLQPFGKVPAVKYDDRILFESRSILRYIAKNNQDIKDLLGGVEADVWLEAESQNYNPPVSRIVNEKVFKKWRGERADMDVIKTSVEELERVLDVYETRLSTVPFLGGEQFSIADISHIPYTNYLLKCGYKNLFKDRPNVYRWLKKIIKRDSVQYLVERDEVEDGEIERNNEVKDQENKQSEHEKKDEKKDEGKDKKIDDKPSNKKTREAERGDKGQEHKVDMDDIVENLPKLERKRRGGKA